MSYKKEIIKMPSTIKTLKDFKNWCNDMNKGSNSLFIKMKRSDYGTPQGFYEENGKIEYTIDGRDYGGSCTISRFNQVFKFLLITHPLK